MARGSATSSPTREKRLPRRSKPGAHLPDARHHPLPRVVRRAPFARRLGQVDEQIAQRIEGMRVQLVVCVVDLVRLRCGLTCESARMSPLQRAATTIGWTSSASRSMMRTQPSRTAELRPCGRGPLWQRRRTHSRRSVRWPPCRPGRSSWRSPARPGRSSALGLDLGHELGRGGVLR